VLYLAEVKNQTKNFIGVGFKTELKLLASQNSDQTWNRVAGEEVVVCETINDHMGKGGLFIVNLGTNNQIQGVPELAANRLLNFLQYLSKILEKSKTQEEDIEQWRMSLTMQAEELANRRAELEGQQEYIEQKEGEFAQLEAEKNKLHQAWEQVREEQRRLQDKKGLERDQVARITNLLEGLTSINPQSLGQNFNQINEMVRTIQAILDQYWQQLQQDKNQLYQKQQEVERYTQNLHHCRQDVQATLESLQQAQTDLIVQKNILQTKEELLQQINLILDSLQSLRDNISDLKDDSADGDGDAKVDTNILESMPLGDLENIVNKLQEEMKKLVTFVNMQEEELTVQADYVREIEQKMAQASEIEKFDLDTELADAQEAMKLLNKTLVGQRRSIKKQQKTLNQHLRILSRRKGVFDLEAFDIIDLDPLLQNVEDQIQITQSKKEILQSEIDSLRQSLNEIQPMVEQQNQMYQQQEVKLQQEQEKTEQAQIVLAQIQSKVSFLEQALDPLQNRLNAIRDSWQNIEPSLSKINNLISEQGNVVNEMKALLN
jgi:chromosome segregation ATPase